MVSGPETRSALAIVALLAASKVRLQCTDVSELPPILDRNVGEPEAFQASGELLAIGEARGCLDDVEVTIELEGAVRLP